MLERRATSNAPVIRAAAIRWITGPTWVTTFGQVWPQIAELCALGQLPCAGQGQDVTIVVLSHEAQGRVGSKARLGDDHQLARPGWRDQGRHHLATQDSLVPAEAGITQPQRHGETTPIPTRHQEDQAQATRGGSRLTLACRVAQRMLPP